MSEKPTDAKETEQEWFGMKHLHSALQAPSPERVSKRKPTSEAPLPVRNKPPRKNSVGAVSAAALKSDYRRGHSEMVSSDEASDDSSSDDGHELDDDDLDSQGSSDIGRQSPKKKHKSSASTSSSKPKPKARARKKDMSLSEEVLDGLKAPQEMEMEVSAELKEVMRSGGGVDGPVKMETLTDSQLKLVQHGPVPQWLETHALVTEYKGKLKTLEADLKKKTDLVKKWMKEQNWKHIPLKALMERVGEQEAKRMGGGGAVKLQTYNRRQQMTAVQLRLCCIKGIGFELKLDSLAARAKLKAWESAWRGNLSTYEQNRLLRDYGKRTKAVGEDGTEIQPDEVEDEEMEGTHSPQPAEPEEKLRIGGGGVGGGGGGGDIPARSDTPIPMVAKRATPIPIPNPSAAAPAPARPLPSPQRPPRPMPPSPQPTRKPPVSSSSLPQDGDAIMSEANPASQFD